MVSIPVEARCGNASGDWPRAAGDVAGRTRPTATPRSAAPRGSAHRGAAVSPDDISDILFTSGTTGRSKGAMSSHRQALAVAAAWAECGEVRARTATWC